MEEVFEEPTARYWLDAEGNLRGVLNAGADFQMQDAVQMMALHHRMAQGKPRCLVMDITALRTMPREVRAYFMRPEHVEVHRAVALVVGSALSRAVGNFFLGLNKPAMPMRLVSTADEALAWFRTLPRH